MATGRGLVSFISAAAAAILAIFVFLLLNPSRRHLIWFRDSAADLVVRNATIYTSVASIPFAEAMAVRNGRILRIGTDAHVRGLIGYRTHELNLEGKVVLPGFIDSHVHLISGGLQMGRVKLQGIKSKEDFVMTVKEAVKDKLPGDWLLGGGWNNDIWGGELPDASWIDDITRDNPVWFVRMDGHMGLANSLALKLAGITNSSLDPVGGTILTTSNGDKLPGDWLLGGRWNNDIWGGELPDASWIDDITRDNPVWFVRMDGHMGLANSLALKLAGITNSSWDPVGGTILKTSNGADPTGLLIDSAMKLVLTVIPEISVHERQEALIRASKYALMNGVTTMVDMGRYFPGASVDDSWQDLSDVYKWADSSGKMLIRVCLFFPLQTWSRLRDLFEDKGRSLSQWIYLGGVKAFADGSLGSNSALFHEPYEDDPHNYGLQVSDFDWLFNATVASDKTGLQVAVHAIGDKANDMVLDLFNSVKSINEGRDHRFRVAVHAIGDKANDMVLDLFNSVKSINEESEEEESTPIETFLVINKRGGRAARGHNTSLVIYEADVEMPSKEVHTTTPFTDSDEELHFPDKESDHKGKKIPKEKCPKLGSISDSEEAQDMKISKNSQTKDNTSSEVTQIQLKSGK
ncbi:hypothetical protein MA16_Dca002029 [Dendrobium catenatum]|uniref:Amidohydrolase 3 domain-containing protein n=1 Tax=Dendrobium catenatum TaxID=906689 RepID=A0A2I0XE54_9ASPA|nr:hypothetical protein MA16_Dca002029 [Dendrobium catenatum]